MGNIDIGKTKIKQADRQDDHQAGEGGKEFAFEHIARKKEVVERIHKDHVTGQKTQVSAQGPRDGVLAENVEAKHDYGEPEKQMHQQTPAGHPSQEIDIHGFG